MLVNDGQVETEKFVEQFYTSKNYQGRLEAIQYLIGNSRKYSFPETICIEALNDFCSQIKVYVLKNYNFHQANDPQIKLSLENLARHDEKIQVRTLAIEKLAGLDSVEHDELFFSTSLLKSSNESAAGLRGLFKLDKVRAYQVAKFRAESSSGSLDLAIAEIFQAKGNIDDLSFFKDRLKDRTKFNKIGLVRIYLKMLCKIERVELIKQHLQYICEDISLSANTDLVQRLVMELYHFNSEQKAFLAKNCDLDRFISNTIDLLLEKNYLKAKGTDPFGFL